MVSHQCNHCLRGIIHMVGIFQMKPPDSFPRLTEEGRDNRDESGIVSFPFVWNNSLFVLCRYSFLEPGLGYEEVFCPKYRRIFCMEDNRKYRSSKHLRITVWSIVIFFFFAFHSTPRKGMPYCISS